VAAGECALTLTRAGVESLTASYAGDATFKPSSSAAAAHTVNRADTTTGISTNAQTRPSSGSQ
jgi:hypothetical protein